MSRIPPKGAVRRLIPESTVAELLYRNDHTCCICRQPRKAVQIHHINSDPSDNRMSNLVVVCADCHSRVESNEGHGRRFLPREVEKYKKQWEEQVGRIGKGELDSRFAVLKPEIPKPTYCMGKEDGESCLHCAALFDVVVKYLHEDQIPASGGWGLSQSRMYAYITGHTPTELETREGGIVSTYIPTRALAAVEARAPFRGTALARRAVEYLITRQNKSGAFGRYVDSRSGMEIHTSIRHTAYAVLALVELDGPPENILQGLHYLSKTDIVDLRDDSSPSMASAAVVQVFDNIVGGKWGQTHLGEDDRSGLGMNKWPERRIVLLRFIENESRSASNSYSPLWIPYGRFEKKLFDTALFTVDLLTLGSRLVLWEVVLKVLKKVAENVGEGLPFDPSAQCPDVGLSAYFCSVCFRPMVLNALQQSKDGQAVLQRAQKCFDFVRGNLGEQQFMTHTNCDTLSNLLLMKGCYWRQAHSVFHHASQSGGGLVR